MRKASRSNVLLMAYSYQWSVPPAVMTASISRNNKSEPKESKRGNPDIFTRSCKRVQMLTDLLSAGRFLPRPLSLLVQGDSVSERSTSSPHPEGKLVLRNAGLKIMSELRRREDCLPVCLASSTTNKCYCILESAHSTSLRVSTASNGCACFRNTSGAWPET